MAFFSEIFFSTLIGKPVYMVDEKYYGSFRDFVVRRQNENFKITKVRIKPQKGERIVVAWSDIHSIETDPVSLKLKKRWTEIKTMDYDEDEFRLKRDFLDQQIIDTNALRVVRVNDLKIVAVGDELFVVAADIGLRGLLRRLGIEQWVISFAHAFRIPFPNTLIPSAYIDPFPARLRHDITLTVAHEKLKDMHPADLADIMEKLDSYERLSILHSLPPENMAHTIEELEPDVRKKLLAKLRDDMLKTVLERLSPDSATDIVAELPRHRMHKVLGKLSSKNEAEIRGLLKFKKDTAGSVMNTEFIALPGSYTVGQAVRELRKRGKQAEHIFYLYLVDDEGTLKGAISLRELLFVSAHTQLALLVKRKPVYSRTREDIDRVVEKLSKYNLVAIPVVGLKKKLEGVITVDDVIPLLREEAG